MKKAHKFPETLFVTTDPHSKAEVFPSLLAYRSAEAAFDEPIGAVLQMAVYSIERVIEVEALIKTIKSTKP